MKFGVETALTKDPFPPEPPFSLGPSFGNLWKNR